MNDKVKKRIDMIIKIVLIIIIILLLIRNCDLLRKNGNTVPGCNIIDIDCDDDSCNVDSLSFTQDKIGVVKGDSTKLVVIISSNRISSGKLKWTSSDTSIVTVDDNGVVKGINIGTAAITVTSSNGKKATCIIEVTAEMIDVENITLIPNKTSISKGKTTIIKVEFEPSNATNRDLVWTSSDDSIASVNSNGIVKGLKAGTVTITAKTKDGKAVGTTTITIKGDTEEITSLEFAQKKVSVKKGDSTKLIVTIKPSSLSSSKLNWKSSNTNIVTVDDNGVIKGINTGTATITVTSSNGKTATCIVEVINNTINVEKIVLIPNETLISIDSTTQIVAVISPENATNRDLVWSSSDTSIATVNSNGIVKGIKAGTVTITAKTKDGKVVASTTITVNDETDDFEVYDEDHPTPSWNGSSDLNIFSKTENDRIAPESSDTYQFVVKNSAPYNMKYQIDFIETNNYNINMKFKLKKNDIYLVDHYVSASELNVNDILLNIGENDTYYLEWKWISSSNDTSIGKNPAANYSLKIDVKAEGIND